ncbi:MAG: hypothetical protein ACK4FF_08725 [Limnobacter sp.]|uniref:hypothetical protein n=1 Tax=Limnobacter sp. TaxID=2003368 RepID=UPI00391A8DA6
MLKKSVSALSILAAFMSIHTAASATCVGADCDVRTNVEVNFDTSYYLSPNAKGIYIQSNTGDRLANVQLDNVKMTNTGDITAAATAVGNIANFEVNTGSTTNIRHINQTSNGDQLANVKVLQSLNSKTGQVELEALAIGNSVSILNQGTSLSDLSIAQCNVGDGVASVNFRYDPTKLTATATAIGNSIAVRTVR